MSSKKQVSTQMICKSYAFTYRAIAAALHDIADKRASKQSKKQLINCFEVSVLTTKQRIKHTKLLQTNGGMKGSTILQESGGWRIIQSANSDDEPDELVMRLQGVLCDKYLPPVEEMPR